MPSSSVSNGRSGSLSLVECVHALGGMDDAPGEERLAALRQLEQAPAEPVWNRALVRALSHTDTTVRGAAVELSAREFDLLRLLATNAGRVVTRRALLDGIWGPDFYGDERALDVYIRFLRKKIERDPDRPELIRTVRGVGYSLETAVRA